MSDYYTVTITITRADGDTEESRTETYSRYLCYICPQCGAVNYCYAAWCDADDPHDTPRCEQCQAPRTAADDNAATLRDLCWCDHCKRWIDADDLPRHLLTKHLALPASESDDMFPGILRPTLPT